MIESMTGFGRASCSADGREMTVELKSVNHRYLDIAYRMPRHIGFIEDALRIALGECLARGHVDVFINYRNLRNDARTVSVDTALLGQYICAAREANAVLGLRDDITLAGALRLPDVTDIVEAAEDREAVTALAVQTLKQAAAELRAMRKAEGARLYKDLYARADVLAEITARIAERAPTVVTEYRDKLSDRIAALLQGADVDPQRLAMEVAVFADKACIDEELVRMGSHLEQYRALLNGEEPAGRKLDFLVQEMNREFNTMGSKANDAALVRAVLLGKGEIEKIREQIQNIE